MNTEKLITTCKTCQCDVAASATVCPSCGAATAKLNDVLYGVGLGLMMLIALVMQIVPYTTKSSPASGKIALAISPATVLPDGSAQPRSR